MNKEGQKLRKLHKLGGADVAPSAADDDDVGGKTPPIFGPDACIPRFNLTVSYTYVTGRIGVGAT